ncbi:signal peptidase I [Candidatus Soleaferrea massiliensis]|uniref:signal peptidase I n=1 Tax=Candidatus Soleaferrea massiliensis TaxID=1470354 RepID=UPI00058E5D5D|nr:signal peptidase I [Candidatus Soleaferrea massiliensis]
MNKKKTLTIVGRVVTALILIFTVFIMIFTIFSVNSFNKDEGGLFGYKFYIVLSDSMKGEFQSGDVVASKDVDADQLQPGDIITFKSVDPENYGEVVTHKIRSITDYEGQKAFVTYGIALGNDDTYPVPADRVIGQYQYAMPKLGYFFQFLKSPMGYIVLIFIPFALLLIMQSVKFFRLLKRYKKEQQAEIDRQKEEVEEERRKAREMLEEIERLKAQVQGRETGSQTAAAVSEAAVKTEQKPEGKEDSPKA